MPNPTAPQLELAGFEGFVPMEMWGKDHRTTLLYAETRAVDYGGVLDARHMRSDAKYPSYLANNVQLKGHDDYDCLRDAEHAGLLHFANLTVEFTDAGWEYVGKLRRERAERSFKGIKMADLAALVGANGVDAPGGH